jgi:hypothetical protein
VLPLWTWWRAGSQRGSLAVPGDHLRIGPVHDKVDTEVALPDVLRGLSLLVIRYKLHMTLSISTGKRLTIRATIIARPRERDNLP